MKKALMVLVMALSVVQLTGCVARMTNDMVIAEAMKCENVGLPWRQSTNYDGSVSNVYCMPHYERRSSQ